MSSHEDRRRFIGPGTASAATGQGRVTDRLQASAHLILMSLLIVGAVIVGWSILPGRDERIEALERDGQVRRAYELMQARFDSGDRRQRTMSQLQRFYELYGDNDKLLKVLEVEAAQRPRDLFVLRRLAKHFHNIQDDAGEMRALRAQLAVRYSEPACFRLIGLLRSKGDFAGEQKVLLDCRAEGYRRPEELTRLAFLVAADGDFAQSAAILAAVDDRRWVRENRHRLMLFEMLLEVKRYDDAMRRSVRWLKGQPDDDLALDFVTRFIGVGRNDLALDLARQIGQPGDSVSLAVGEILIEQVQLDAARIFLRGWLDQPGPATDLSSGEVAGRFIAAAIDAGDADLALRGAERHGMDRTDQTELVSIAEALAADGNAVSFDKVRAQLSPEAIASNLLVAAAVEIREGRYDAARAALGRVRTETLDERRLGAYERIVGQLGRPRGSGVTLRDPVRPPSALPPPDVTVEGTQTESRKINSPQAISKRFRLRKNRPTQRTPRTPVARPAVKQAPAAPEQTKGIFKFPVQ